jgi:hypothetical protein
MQSQSKVNSAIRQRRTTYVILSLVFVLAVIVAALVARQNSLALSLSWLDAVFFVLSVTRLGRLVSFDAVFETYRLPFVETVADESGAGNSTRARGVGWRQAIGELLSCPICSGTWAALVLVIMWLFVPDVARLFVYILGATGALEVLNAFVEFSSWRAQVYRETVGNMHEIRAAQKAAEDDGAWERLFFDAARNGSKS